jgi:hypothetical protein
MIVLLDKGMRRMHTRLVKIQVSHTNKISKFVISSLGKRIPKSDIKQMLIIMANYTLLSFYPE